MQPFRATPDPDAEVESVAIDRFDLLPLGDLGVGGNAWELHPVGLLGAAWDSNPLQTTAGGGSDLQLRLAAGLETRFLGADGWRTSLGGMLRAQRYADTPSRDFTGGDAHVGIRHSGQASRVALDGSWSRDADPLYELPEQVKRERFDGRLTIENDQRSSAWSCGAAVSSLNYLEDTSLFRRDERDYRSFTGFGGWQALGGAGSSLGVVAAGTIFDRPSASSSNGYAGGSLDGQWQHALSSRSSLSLLLGSCLRRYADASFGNPASGDRTLIRPEFSARLLWNWEERSWLTIAASSGLADGLLAGVNASRLDGVESLLSVRLRDRLDLVAHAWAVRRTDLAAKAGEARLRVDNLYLRLGPDYRLRNGLGLRLWAAWNQETATNGSDFGRTMAALEMLVAL